MTAHFDLAIVGAGMTGLCAAVFAASRGLSTVVLGPTGSWAHPSGLFDLLGVYPLEEKKRVHNPWDALKTLMANEPSHPYGLVGEPALRDAFSFLLDVLSQRNYSYFRVSEANSELITSLGTRKTTYCLPATMGAGVQAWQRKSSCLLIDFFGLKDYSAQLVASNLRSAWPLLRWSTVECPGTDSQHEISPAFLARQFDEAPFRDRLAERITPLLQGAIAVGLPAVLGFEHSLGALEHLQNRLGVPVFEIPCTPGFVPGLRLRAAFEKALHGLGAKLMTEKVVRVRAEPPDGFVLFAGETDALTEIRAPAVLLATGRFLAGGLAAERTGVRETVFNLPVWQPDARQAWHRADLF
ncbi:MAG TPA: glycerol-3-phosphate dehydrogenase subunit GlpB, partial [Polyangiaceae bacterium]|nr:glycerol-3-phosphate dehydrogenase subunit GlpB [Polyangiaceae bacterium]